MVRQLIKRQSLRWVHMNRNRCREIRDRSISSLARDGDTIYALSSAEGKAGVAVIRVSGKQAQTCLQTMTRLKRIPKPRTYVYHFPLHIDVVRY